MRKLIYSGRLLFLVTLLFLSLSLNINHACAANLVIGKTAEPSTSNFYLTSSYGDDAACVQAALDAAGNGDTVTIREGDYSITRQIRENNKSLNIIGEGKATFNLNVGSEPGLYFSGSMVANPTLSTNAQKGSSQVVLNNASLVHPNDLIRIWKNVQWCPLNYAKQMTGELYLVKSVSGNTVTLNQPLLRDYNLSETVKTEIFRPIEMHVQNIHVQNLNGSGEYEGLAFEYNKDSTITDSWFKDNGQASIRIYTSFNVDVKNNEIYNSAHDGYGYGVSVADASAFVNIENNNIQNCRHTIMSGTRDFKALNRDVFISNNTLLGLIDAHPMTISYTVIKNKITARESGSSAFYDGTLYSVFSENEVYGGSTAVRRRGSVNGGVHVIKDNYMEGSIYKATGYGAGDALIIIGNTQSKGDHGINFNYHGSESFRNLIIAGNHFNDIQYYGIYLKFIREGGNVSVYNNTFTQIDRHGVLVEGGTYTNSINIWNNILSDIGMQNDTASGMMLNNVKNASICGNQISDINNFTNYGVYEGTGSDYNSFSGNAITGMSKGTIFLTGTHSKVTSGTCANPTTYPKYILSILNGVGYGVYNLGDTVAITANDPMPGKVFDGWTGDTQYVSNPASATTTITIPNAFVILNASYKDASPSLTTIPTAEFNADTTSGSATLSVQFTDLSQNANGWNWDFGDGATSTDRNPVHTYSSAGTYTVTLTVSNEGGTVSKVNTINVLEEGSSSDGSSGGSSHSSGGGGAGGSPEPARNVQVKEISQTFITNGKPVKFDFAKNATCIVYVTFDAKKTAGKTTAIAES